MSTRIFRAYRAATAPYGAPDAFWVASKVKDGHLILLPFRPGRGYGKWHVNACLHVLRDGKVIHHQAHIDVSCLAETSSSQVQLLDGEVHASRKELDRKLVLHLLSGLWDCAKERSMQPFADMGAAYRARCDRFLSENYGTTP